MPLVHVAVFIHHATPFMEDFLERLTTLNYPLGRIRLFIHNNVSPQSGFWTVSSGSILIKTKECDFL